MNSANVALLQLCSGAETQVNLNQIEQQIKRLDAGIKLVLTPENALLFSSANDYRQHAEQHNDGPLQQAVRQLACHYGIWLLIGSMPMISRESAQLITTSSLLFDSQGELRARYDKMHMFDAIIDDNHRYYSESTVFQPGQHLTVTETPIGRLGMTICYDLRFPGLYQALCAQGAEMIVVPAAFTHITGKAHWEILLRDRAIENQCIMLAPAQTGKHENKRYTWGHSMIVNAWGKILAQNADDIATVTANVDVKHLQKIRSQMPVIKTNRFQPTLADIRYQNPPSKEQIT